MKLETINESFHKNFILTYWDEDSDQYDPWVAIDQAEKIAKDSGIRIASNKELSFIAFDAISDDVIGATWKNIYSDEEGMIYDFDVAVDKNNRGSNVGLGLIEVSISDYIQNNDGDMKIRVWVVNPKLVRVLERKYGFEVMSQYPDGSAHMEYSE